MFWLPSIMRSSYFRYVCSVTLVRNMSAGIQLLPTEWVISQYELAAIN